MVKKNNMKVIDREEKYFVTVCTSTGASVSTTMCPRCAQSQQPTTSCRTW